MNKILWKRLCRVTVVSLRRTLSSWLGVKSSHGFNLQQVVNERLRLTANSSQTRLVQAITVGCLSNLRGTLQNSVIFTWWQDSRTVAFHAVLLRNFLPLRELSRLHHTLRKRLFLYTTILTQTLACTLVSAICNDLIGACLFQFLCSEITVMVEEMKYL